MKLIEDTLQRLPSRAASGIGYALSLCAGAGAGVMLYYVLYRIDLPSKPFIYVAF